MDYEVLKTELSTDPLGIGYAGMTDKAAAIALNTKDRPTIVETYANAKTILSKLGATTGAAFLDDLEATAATDSAVKWAMSFITSPEGINVGDSETRAMLDQLAASGVLNADDVAVVKGLAETNISRAEELGLGVIRSGEVEEARAS